MTEPQTFSEADVMGAPAQPVVAQAPLPPGDGSVVDVKTRAALNPAQTATYRQLLDSGRFDPKAPPGSENLPLHQTAEGEEPPKGQWFVDLSGAKRQAGGAAAPNYGSYNDSDVGLSGEGIPGRKSLLLGLEEGIAKPWLHLQSVTDADPTARAVLNGLDNAVPGVDVARAAVRNFGPTLAGDIAAREGKGYIPARTTEFAGNMADAATIPGGPLLSGAGAGILLSKADDSPGLVRDAALGAIGSKVGSKVIGAGVGMISPKVAPQVQTLLDAGIPLTLGQIKGGALKRVEDGLKSLPMVGDVIGSAQARTSAGLNLAVANRALKPIGEAIPADVAPGRDAIAYAGDKLSERYTALMPKLDLTIDKQLGQDVNAIWSGASNLSLEGQQQLGNIIRNNIMAKVDPATGKMSGADLKDAESTLGLMIRRYGKSPLPADQNLADGLGMTRQVLRDWVTRTNPAHAQELGRLNEGWANLAIGEDAASRLGAHEGLFTPSQLAGAVRAANDSVRKRSYARGDALMQDLSDAALARLPSSVPDSGSPFRHILEAGVAGLVGKEAGMGPAMGKAGLAATVLSAPYTQAGQKFTQNLLTGARPAYSPALAALLQRLDPLAQAAGATGAVRLTSPQ